MARLRLATFCSLGVLASALPGVAQAQSAPSLSDPGRLPSGNATNSQKLAFSLTDYFDTNIPRLSDGRPNPRNFVRKDMRITPAVDLNYVHRLGPHQVGVQAAVGYDLYVRNKGLNSARFLVAPSAYLNLPVCDVSIGGQVSRRQSDLGELVYFGIDPTQNTRNIQTNEGVNGQLICGAEQGLRPTFAAGYSEGHNSNPVRIRSNYQTTYLQPSLAYSSPTLGNISVFARKTVTDLPNQLTLAGLNGGYELHGYGAQYERAVGRNLNLRASVSHVSVTPRGGVGARRSGNNFDGAVTVQLGSNLQLVGVASREFTSTLTADAAYELDQTYGLTANYAVSPQLRFRLRGQVSPRQFFYSTTTVGPRIGEQTLRSLSAGASQTIGRRMRLDVEGGYTERTADISTFDYRAFHTLVGLAITF